MKVSFDNLEVAFKDKSTEELKFSYRIFKLMSNPTLVKFFSKATVWALKLHLPIEWMVRKTVYRQFCGGETINKSLQVVERLGKSNVKSILDYSVEGEDNEQSFEQTKKELLRIIDVAAKNPFIPVTCIKLTGIMPSGLLEKVTQNGMENLTSSEKQAFEQAERRLDEICKKSYETGVPIYIDAEESWIQGAIDMLAELMMGRYNSKKAVVFTTVQMYRWDRLEYLQNLIEKARKEETIVGVKVVRGAYMEKENMRALEMGYPSPIQPDKEHTDRDYDKAIELLVENIDIAELCAGTHNEKSCYYLMDLMAQKGLAKDDRRIYFSQLYGMSDNISFNLAHAGYNVSKYLPYGPVKSTIPYLIRRAEENTAIAGQMGKEIQLIEKELKRRKAL
jgi:proline dehydrogenase